MLDFRSMLMGGKLLGGGGNSGKDIWYQKGSFDAEDTVQTVSHGAGKVPDMLLVFSESVPMEGYINFTMGVSASVMSALGNLYCVPTIVFASAGSIQATNNIGMEADMSGSTFETMGVVRSVTETEFTVGASTGSAGCLKTGESYGYFMIGGLI